VLLMLSMVKGLICCKHILHMCLLSWVFK
jgi:hypothetical protein